MVFYRNIYLQMSSWQPLAGENFPSESVAYAIAVAPLKGASSGYLYCVATWMVGVGCSRNGDTWNSYQEGLPTDSNAPTRIGGFSGNMRGITALAFDANDPRIMHAFLTDGHFYRSNNYGQTWLSGTYTLPHETKVTRLAAKDRLVIAVAHNHERGGSEQLYISTDGGQSWQPQASDGVPPGGRVYDAAIDIQQGAIVAATSTGLWEAQLRNSKWTWQALGLVAESRLVGPIPGTS